MMQGKTVPLLLAALVLAAALPATALPAPALEATSKHIIVFNGSAWGPVVKEKRQTLEAAIVSDINTKLIRKFVFNTTVVTNFLAADKNLEAHVTVTQTLLPDAPTPKLQNIWGPEEVNSMITRANFRTTLVPYPGPGKAVLVSVYVPDKEKALDACTGACKGAILVGVAVAAGTVVTTLVVFFYICCRCAK
ncbi:hypothetical protein TRSC58_05206 [Trypanosoma rangeli SC58]|uniref:Uncharacterized protein n=1 Tax=Trypanosoma rangeli SC58 TaxID=429131 RepID=A0A061IZ54_TRYRA|nr:hypothetical protein TRSC58_05206 [Trypanosoma rangeli SC58]